MKLPKICVCRRYACILLHKDRILSFMWTRRISKYLVFSKPSRTNPQFMSFPLCLYYTHVYVHRTHSNSCSSYLLESCTPSVYTSKCWIFSLPPACFTMTLRCMDSLSILTQTSTLWIWHRHIPFYRLEILKSSTFSNLIPKTNMTTVVVKTFQRLCSRQMDSFIKEWTWHTSCSHSTGTPQSCTVAICYNSLGKQETLNITSTLLICKPVEKLGIKEQI